jgi:hypothetical protein
MQNNVVPSIRARDSLELSYLIKELTGFWRWIAAASEPGGPIKHVIVTGHLIGGTSKLTPVTTSPSSSRAR